jgi:hypothetical protein
MGIPKKSMMVVHMSFSRLSDPFYGIVSGKDYKDYKVVIS